MLPTPKQAVQDAAVEELKVPDKLYQAESFYVEVMVRSTFKTSGELRIYEDNREIGRERVDVTPGENRYAVKDWPRTGTPPLPCRNLHGRG